MAWIRRMGDEEGISLVEMLVSILLMGLVLTALGNTLMTSMASARQNEGLTHATALVNERMERLQAQTWNALVPGPAVTDPTPVSRGRRSYTITTRVQWLDSPTNRYKGFWVRANWTENGRPQQLQVDGRRAYRAGDNTSSSADPFRILIFSINPDPVNISSTGQTLSSTDPALPGGAAMLLEVRTSHPAACGSVVVSWPQPTPTQSVTLTKADGTACTAAGASNWHATVPAGQTYAAGWMNFQATATRAAAPGETRTAESAAYLQAPVTMTSLVYDTLNPRSYDNTPTGAPPSTVNRVCVNLAPPQTLRNNYPFYLELRGLTEFDTVVLRRTDVAGVQFPMTFGPSPYGPRWTATVPGGTSTAGGGFTPGTFSQWEVRWTRTSYDNLTSTIPLQFYVFNRNGDSPCQNH